MTTGAPLGYFDTSALMRWLESDVPQPRELNTRIAVHVERLLKGGDRLAISQTTIVELLSNITKNWRMEDAQSLPFDSDWAGRSRQRFMALLADGRLEVIPIPVHAVEQAIALVDIAATDHRQAVGVPDAIHLITACAWAYRESATVRFYTSDDDFGQLTDLYPYFLRFAEVVNLEIASRPTAS